MPIRVLPPQLANQIAAGEVVERPASVVKELVENSLDAGATQIDIDIEKGGSRLIRVRDNGCGVAEHELVLALSRHATSKIAGLDDLENITSLGFRGEALASISSVSRLVLTSRPAEQDAAWQACAAGRDMAVEVKPAAHPVGTTIEVADLFFNTPARRKFLRTEKTEFAHIDELVKRLALSRYDVCWTLTHNGQQARRLKAAETSEQQQKRVAALCGRAFADKAAYVENSYGDLSLKGWLLAPDACTAQAGCQYSYVNGRMMRDKLLNHAIRQAYGELLLPEQQPAFVIYLELDPRQVDVNVHPAKHEVRFHQSRLVHDFVVSALGNALQQLSHEPVLPLPDITEHQIREPAITASYGRASARGAMPASFKVVTDGGYPYQHGHAERARPAGTVVKQQLAYLQQQSDSVVEAPVCPAAESQASYGELISQNCYLLRNNGNEIMLIDIAVTAGKAWQMTPLPPAPLLMPLRLPLNIAEKQQLLQLAEQIAGYGFDILIQNETAIVRAVPVFLRQTALSQWLPVWFRLLIDSSCHSTGLLQLLLHEKFLAANVVLEHFRSVFDDMTQWHAVPLLLDATLNQFSELSL